MVDQHLLIQNLEEKAEELVRKTRKYLPHIGRFCLISTFVEDGFRMVNQWGEQRDYIGKTTKYSSLFKMSFRIGLELRLVLGGYVRFSQPRRSNLRLFLRHDPNQSKRSLLRVILHYIYANYWVLDPLGSKIFG